MGRSGRQRFMRQRRFVALPAERAHDLSIVDRFCSGGGPADVAVALPSGDQVDMQVRDPLPAGGAVVLPDREPIRLQPLAEQPRSRLDRHHQRGGGVVVEVPDALDVSPGDNEGMARRRRVNV